MLSVVGFPAERAAIYPAEVACSGRSHHRRLPPPPANFTGAQFTVPVRRCDILIAPGAEVRGSSARSPLGGRLQVPLPPARSPEPSSIRAPSSAAFAAGVRVRRPQWAPARPPMALPLAPARGRRTVTATSRCAHAGSLPSGCQPECQCSGSLGAVPSEPASGPSPAAVPAAPGGRRGLQPCQWLLRNWKLVQLEEANNAAPRPGALAHGAMAASTSQ